MRTSSSLDHLIDSTVQLWDKKFKAHMASDSQAEFERSTKSISSSYKRSDYLGCLMEIHQNYLAFLDLTETFEVTKTGTRAFDMRDTFKVMYKLVAREFVERKLPDKAEKISSPFTVNDNDTLLAINPVSGQFELITENSLFYVSVADRVTSSKPELVQSVFRRPKAGKTLTFDNSGKILGMADRAFPTYERLPISKEGLVYRIMAPLSSR